MVPEIFDSLITELERIRFNGVTSSPVKTLSTKVEITFWSSLFFGLRPPGNPEISKSKFYIITVGILVLL